MLIIAGPSGAGKTVLINRMLRNECPQLCEQLGVADPTSMRCLVARELYGLPGIDLGQALIHYDLYAQFRGRSGFRRLDQVIARAHSVTVLTIHIPTSVLLERSHARYRLALSRLSAGDRRDRYLRLPHKFARLWWKNTRYRQGYSDTLYDHWFDYLASHELAGNWQVDTSIAGEPIASVPRPQAGSGVPG